MDEVDPAGAAPAALEALNELTRPRVCLSALDADQRWPEPVPSVQSIERRVAKAEALALMHQGKDVAEAAMKEAEQAGLHRLAARVQLAAAVGEPSLERFTAAALAAEAAREPLLAAQAWQGILRLHESTDTREAKLAALHSRAFLSAAGGDAGLESRVEVSLAQVFAKAGGLSEAIAAADRAITLAGNAFPESHVVRAEAHAARAAAAVGDFGVCGDNALRAAQEMEDALGPSHPRTSAFQSELGETVLRNGRAYDARKLFEKAHRSAVAAFGPRSAEVARASSALAQVELAAGNPKAALDWAKQARETFEELFGKDAAELAPALAQAGEALRLQQRCEEAMPLFSRTLELRPRDHAARAAAYLGMAQCHLEQGKTAQALGLLNTSLTDIAPELDGELRFALGRTLWDSSTGEQARARRLVEEALPKLPRGPKVEAQLWLGKHTSP